MTVRDALNTLGITERQLNAETLEVELQRRLLQLPDDAARWQAAYDRLTEFLNPHHAAASETSPSAAVIVSSQTGSPSVALAEKPGLRHTQEILIFDENREVIAAAESLEPIPSDSSVDLELLTNTDEQTVAFIAEPRAAFVNPEPPLPAPSFAAQDETYEPLWQPRHTPDSTSTSGEWESMLEMLEADGLLKTQDEEVPAVAPSQPLTQEAVVNASGLETLLFDGPIAEDWVTPNAVTPSLEVTNEESRNVSDEAPFPSLETTLPAPLPAAPLPGVSKLESPVAPRVSGAELKVSPVDALPRDLQARPKTVGRTTEAPPFERRTSASSRTPQREATRSYRDARERETQVRAPRRKQPVWLWTLALSALGVSVLWFTPGLAKQLQATLFPVRAPVKVAPAPVAVPKPAVRKPVPLEPKRAPVSASTRPAPRPGASSKPASSKPTSGQPPKPVAVVKPASVTPPSPAVTTTPQRPVASSAATGASNRPTSPRTVSNVSNRAVTATKPVTPRAKPTPARSGPETLPPVTRPEGVTTPPKPVAAKPVAKPKPRPAPSAPPPAPVAQIEYQDEARAETQMVGGLTREQFGRQFLNRKQFEVWQSQGETLQFASWADIPLETQILSSADFRAAVLVSSPVPRPQSTERP